MSNINIVNAKTTTTNFQMTSGATNGYVLTSDSNGNATWLPVSFTGNTSGDCITDLYVTNLYGCSPITVNDSIQSVTSSATGTTSFAFGFQNQANGTYSVSLGNQNNSNGNASVSLGNRNTASGNVSVAVGNNTIASGDYSHAQNTRCQAIGTSSFAGGDTSVASGRTSFVFSTNSTVNGNRSVILGGENLTGDRDNTVYVPNFATNGIVQKLGVTTLPAGSTVIPSSSSIVKVQNNGTAVTATLSNGTPGQRLTIYVLSAGSPATGSTDIQPTTSAGFTSAIIGPVGESIDLIYDDTVGWVITGSYGATIS